MSKAIWVLLVRCLTNSATLSMTISRHEVPNVIEKMYLNGIVSFTLAYLETVSNFKIKT